MPCPAPSSQLRGIPLTLHHPLHPRTQITSQCSCQETWLGTATSCCTTFGVPKQESDMFAQGPKGTTPP